MLARMLIAEPTERGVLTTFKTLANDSFEKLNKLVASGKIVRINIETVDKRSLDQNALYWKIIGDCIKNPNSSFATRESLHIFLLKKANVKSEICWIDRPDDLKPKYKAIDILETVTVNKDGNPKRLYICQCYGGSKNFNRKQMSELIELAIDYAAMIGIKTAYGEEWRALNG